MSGSLLLAIFTAIPALYKAYTESIDLFFKQQEAADSERFKDRKAERDAILTAFNKPEATDEERKELRRALYNLNRR